MAEYQSNNSVQQNTRPTITTNMFTLWDRNGIQLRVSGMDNGLSIAMWFPFVEQNGSRKYPVEQRYSTILSQKNVQAFEEILFNFIVPAYQQGKNSKKGIFTNAAHTVMLEVETRDGEFYLNMHRNCDATTRVPQTTHTFKFDVVMVTDEFNQVTGELGVIPVQADFFIFAKAIRAYSDQVGGSVAAHGQRIANNFRNNQFMDYIRAIATAVHAQLPTPAYQQRQPQQQYNAIPSMNNYNAENPNQAYTIPTTQTIEVNDLTDLIG